MLAIDQIRAQFPIFQQSVNGHPIAFLDSAASAQKPQCVIDAESHCYQQSYANIHRGVYQFSEISTRQYEHTRDLVQTFINASTREEIIFTKGATESINLVAHSFGGMVLKTDDIVIISEMEHHANIVPWQMICQQTGAQLKIIPVTDTGELCYDTFISLLNERVKIVAVTHISNVLGTINNIDLIIEHSHRIGAKVLIDGTQGVVHQPIDVTALDADFYVFSSHKLYGPTGVGILYGKKELLDAMPPYQTGGDMIDIVSFEKTTFAPLPNKFEAGTPNIAGVIAFASTLSWLQTIGMDKIQTREQHLLNYAETRLRELNTLTIIGTAAHKASVISFTLTGIHPHDIGTLLDYEGIAVRVGHHCAQPLMRRFKIPATARASFGVYTTENEIDRLVIALKKITQMFA